MEPAFFLHKMMPPFSKENRWSQKILESSSGAQIQNRSSAIIGSSKSHIVSHEMRHVHSTLQIYSPTKVLVSYEYIFFKEMSSILFKTRGIHVFAKECSHIIINRALRLLEKLCRPYRSVLSACVDCEGKMERTCYIHVGSYKEGS